jgi:hypothetical protein
MFPSVEKPAPKFAPGTRVQVIQYVRVGHRRWKTFTIGTVAAESVRPVGGMEMGAKALYSRQPTITLTKEDGELTVVALDENTEVRVLDGAPSSSAAATP